MHFSGAYLAALEGNIFPSVCAQSGLTPSAAPLGSGEAVILDWGGGVKGGVLSTLLPSQVWGWGCREKGAGAARTALGSDTVIALGSAEHPSLLNVQQLLKSK